MLTLRPATMDDAERLFAWRNDPVTRAMSLCTDEVSWEDHVAWLAASLECASREVFIVELNGLPVGTTRRDYGDETELAITIAPEHRCKALPVKALRATIPEGASCVAHIKRENTCSQRLVAILGFNLASDGRVQLWRRPGRSRASLSARG